MSRLNTTVHVYDEGETIVYLPGQEVLPQHREQITAPGVWEDEPDSVETQDTAIYDALVAGGQPPQGDGDQGSDGDQPTGADESAGDGSSDSESGTTGDEGEPLLIPAKAGPGSTTAAWAEYAAKATAARELNIEIPADAGRDDIIDALNDAGIPTE